jgi:hypothetical protein
MITPSISSTQEFMRQHTTRLPEGAVLVAEQQFAGKGAYLRRHLLPSTSADAGVEGGGGPAPEPVAAARLLKSGFSAPCCLPRRQGRQPVDQPSWLPHVHRAEAAAGARLAGALHQLCRLPGGAQGHPGVHSPVAGAGGRSRADAWEAHVWRTREPFTIRLAASQRHALDRPADQARPAQRRPGSTRPALAALGPPGQHQACPGRAHAGGCSAQPRPLRPLTRPRLFRARPASWASASSGPTTSTTARSRSAGR